MTAAFLHPLVFLTLIDLEIKKNKNKNYYESYYYRDSFICQ